MICNFPCKGILKKGSFDGKCLFLEARAERQEARTEKWTTIPLRLCAFARVKNPPRRMRLSALPATEGFARRKKNEARKGLRQSNRAHHYSFAPACGRQVFARIKKISRKVRKTQRPPEVKPSGLQFLCVSATLREEINESPSRNSAGQVYPLVKSLSRCISGGSCPNYSFALGPPQAKYLV